MFKYIIILIKTIYLNFRIFPFSQAITFPVIVGPNVSLTGLYKGCVKCPSKFALVRLGVDNGAFELNKGVRSRLSFEGNGGGIFFTGKTYISSSFHINIAGGKLLIGTNFRSGTGFLVSCAKHIELMDDVLIGWNVSILDADGHKIFKNGILCNESKDIVIGKHCWIASGVTILKGVHLSNDNIVPANNTVTKSSEFSNVIFGGNPNHVITDNINWAI